MIAHTAPCVVCGGTRWSSLPDPGPRSMASDRRIVDEPLGRTVCDTCGLARRVPAPDQVSFFESGYELYAHAPGEARELARQSEYARWIAETISARPASVLDVGCGNGSLLRALGHYWPSAVLLGCDPSAEAIAHGAGDGVQLWRGTAADLPPGLAVGVVLSINVIEHTRDPRHFLQSLRGASADDGHVIVVCPDGGRPGLELLFADHLFSFASSHLETLVRSAGFDVVVSTPAPASLGAFQMVVARRSDRQTASPAVVACRVEGRAEYLTRWRELDHRLADRLRGTVVCFGAGETAGLLRAYAPRCWSLVVACTTDDAPAGDFDGVPMVRLDYVDRNVSLLLGVRPGDQRRVADRLRTRFPHVVEWYDLIDEHD